MNKLGVSNTLSGIIYSYFKFKRFRINSYKLSNRFFASSFIDKRKDKFKRGFKNIYYYWIRTSSYNSS